MDIVHFALPLLQCIQAGLGIWIALRALRKS